MSISFDDWKNDSRTGDLCRLLLECRDALPAISLPRAKLYGVELDLADRIEKALEPWKIADTVLSERTE